MACQQCKSERLLNVNAKCNDCCDVYYKDESLVGYVPRNLQIGGGDCIEFVLCMECGQVQGKFPIPEEEVLNAFD